MAVASDSEYPDRLLLRQDEAALGEQPYLWNHQHHEIGRMDRPLQSAAAVLGGARLAISSFSSWMFRLSAALTQMTCSSGVPERAA